MTEIKAAAFSLGLKSQLFPIGETDSSSPPAEASAGKSDFAVWGASLNGGVALLDGAVFDQFHGVELTVPIGITRRELSDVNFGAGYLGKFRIASGLALVMEAGYAHAGEEDRHLAFASVAPEISRAYLNRGIREGQTYLAMLFGPIFAYSPGTDESMVGIAMKVSINGFKTHKGGDDGSR